MNNESYRVLRFRCAKTARRFIVGFSRTSPYGKYKVVRVVAEQDFTPEDRQAAQLDGPLYEIESVVNRVMDAVPKILRREVSLKDGLLPALRGETKPQIASGSQGKQNTQQKSQQQSQQTPPQYTTSGSFDISDFDFSGWYCPCCGHAKGVNVRTQFLRCGKCGDYICGSRVTQNADGSLSFRCHDRCGNYGTLNGVKSLR